ncbi:MAG: zinc-binding dehydrogenase [Candidatus Binatia bacterium]
MASLTFGLTWGWWRFSDLDLRQASPLLTEPEWRQVFAETGLVDTAVWWSRMATAGNLLMVARAPAGEPAGAAAAELPAGTFLVLADGGGVGDQLAARLVAQGVACALVRPGDRFTRAAAGRFTARPDSTEDLGAVIEASAPLAGVVHLWNLDAEATPADARRLRADADRGAYSVVRLAQALERCEAMPRLWLVTRAAWAVGDGEPVSPAGAAAWGVARAVLAGHPGARGVLVDLDGRGGDQCEALFAEILARAGRRGGGSCAVRSASCTASVAWPRTLLAAPDRTGHPRDLPYRLEAFGAGDDDRVALVATAVPNPVPDEVTVEVAASGLTAADLLKVAHRFPRGPGADALGSELAGTVTRVGRAVTRFQVGDRVMGLGLHCFASHVTTPADLLAPVPAGMSFAEAATVPVAFLAAHLALVHQAGVAAGERVLIHAAASGVGLAAVQVAQRAGARVLATAGSAAKREHLRSLGVERVMDSRSLDFAEAVMAETDGAGVDVVLTC